MSCIGTWHCAMSWLYRCVLHVNRLTGSVHKLIITVTNGPWAVRLSTHKLSNTSTIGTTSTTETIDSNLTSTTVQCHVLLQVRLFFGIQFWGFLELFVESTKVTFYHRHVMHEVDIERLGRVCLQCPSECVDNPRGTVTEGTTTHTSEKHLDTTLSLACEYRCYAQCGFISTAQHGSGQRGPIFAVCALGVGDGDCRAETLTNSMGDGPFFLARFRSAPSYLRVPMHAYSHG